VPFPRVNPVGGDTPVWPFSLARLRVMPLPAGTEVLRPA